MYVCRDHHDVVLRGPTSRCAVCARAAVRRRDAERAERARLRREKAARRAGYG